LRRSALAVQLGGAAGTLAALGADGPRIMEALAAELRLPAPVLPWHAERDRVATMAAALAVLAGTVAKIAGDVVLLAQTEVGEASEASAPGKGGSSTLPQKRNPVDATLALASARLASGQASVLLAAMPQEHERAAGGWQAEWRALPDLFLWTAGAVAHTADAVAGLQIYSGRMQANLDLTRGLIMAESLTMALAPQLGRHEAQTLVQTLCRRALDGGGTLRDAAQADERVNALLPPAAIERALDPAHYLGSNDVFIDRALAGYRAVLAPKAN
jgi:3-carboxy-cis,cis-muconate cycloisomerase